MYMNVIGQYPFTQKLTSTYSISIHTHYVSLYHYFIFLSVALIWFDWQSMMIHVTIFALRAKRQQEVGHWPNFQSIEKDLKRLRKNSGVSFFNFVNFVGQWRTHLQPPVEVDIRAWLGEAVKWWQMAGDIVFSGLRRSLWLCQWLSDPIASALCRRLGLRLCRQQPRLKPMFFACRDMDWAAGLWLELHLQHHPVSRLWDNGGPLRPDPCPPSC